MRHLYLHLVLPLLELMPNMTSLEIDPQEDDESDYSYVVPHMLKTGQKFTNISFNFGISDQQLHGLASAYSASLQELRLYCYDEPNSRTYRAIGMFHRK